MEHQADLIALAHDVRLKQRRPIDLDGRNPDNPRRGRPLLSTWNWLASFFYSYLVATNRPTDPEAVDRFKAAIRAAADKEIGYLAGNAYPVGIPANLRWWGSNTAQGQYA
jgi:hypothetical protein